MRGMLVGQGPYMDSQVVMGVMAELREFAAAAGRR